MSDNPSATKQWFGHPAGLATLFFTELWERFSYYGMRAILVLFMTTPIAAGGLGWPADKAGPLYGLYTMMVYFTALPGGWIADKLIGQKKAVFIGGIIIMAGHISLMFHGLFAFYLGLFLIVVGTGFLKPNISALVGGLYEEGDAKRDAGFSIFYMGINLGAFASPIVCGWLAQDPNFQQVLLNMGIDPLSSWHWGFGAAAVGMGLGVIQYTLGVTRMAVLFRWLAIGLLVAFFGFMMWVSGTAGETASIGIKASLDEPLMQMGIYIAGAVVLLHVIWLVAFVLAGKKVRRVLGFVALSSLVALIVITLINGPNRITPPIFDANAVAAVEESVDMPDSDSTEPEILSEMTSDTQAEPVSDETGSATLDIPLDEAEGQSETDTDSSVDESQDEVSNALETELDTDPEAIPESDPDTEAVAESEAVPPTDQSAEVPTDDAAVPSAAVTPEPVAEIAPEAEMESNTILLIALIICALIVVGLAVKLMINGPVLYGVLGLFVAFALWAAKIHVIEANPSVMMLIVKIFSYVLPSLSYCYFAVIFLIKDWTQTERKRIYAIPVFFLGAAVFWSAFEQAGSSLTLFADRFTFNEFLGFAYPSSWFQSVNAIFIVLLAPVFAWAWTRLGKMDREPSSPLKFGVGLYLLGAGFAVLAFGALVAYKGEGRVSTNWLLSVYLLHTLGELCLSPVGLSTMTKLAPKRLAGQMMGVWFLGAGIGNFIGGIVAGFFESFPLPLLFGAIFLTTLIATIAMLVIVKPVQGLMGGIK